MLCFLTTLAGALCFCCLASAIYVMNDLADVESDRLHEVKRFRPLAAQTVSVKTAKTLLILMLSLTVCGTVLLQNGKCVEKTCSVSGYYNETKCSEFSSYTSTECGLKYKEMGADCWSHGADYVAKEGKCDVDSWRRCCEACVGHL